jgi:polar amino acid transport system ATP-binding protein
MDMGAGLAGLSLAAAGQGVDLQVGEGEIVAVIGGDGWARGGLLRRLVAPQSGVNGAALVVRGLDLQPGVGVGRQLMQALAVAGDPIAAAAQARECLAWVGLAERFEVLPHELSRGQQQRAVIARALVREPQWLLCDDITRQGDMELNGEVAAALQAVAALGVTVLLATADDRFARRVADRVLFLHGGRVHEAGPAQRLFTTPRTRELQRHLAAQGWD